MANLKNTNIDDNLELPSGTTGQRPSSPQEGQIRYNTDLGATEFYNGSNWRPLSDTHPEAEGGTVVDTDIGGVPYRIHYFTEIGTDTLTVTNPGEVEYLIVAGGGSGGRRLAGGGGAGGVVLGNTSISPQSYTITVGAGGAPQGGQNRGENGGNSSAFGLTAFGGGGGGAYTGSTYENGKNGGSGGGGAARSNGGSATQSGPGEFGNDGGNGGGRYAAGGGGGAGGPGNDGILGDPTAQGGGIGISLNITGTLTFYAGGGGGHQYSETSTPGAGGLGGGGNGGLSRNNPQPPGDATPYTGGGGGGGGYYSDVETDSGAGGSGIVIVRYPRNPSLDSEPDRTVIATPPNRFQIVQDSLIYHFDAGSVIGFSGSGNTVKNLASNTPATSTINGAAFVPENRGYFEFDGSNDSIETNLLFDKDDFTYAAWFNWAGDSSEANHDIIDSIDESSAEWARIQIRDGGEFWFIIDNDSSKVNGITGFFANVGEWYYGVGVWTRSSGLMEAYINGEKIYETNHPNTSTITAVNSENIGSNSKGSNEFFNGNIAQAQIYKKALTAVEVRHNFNADRSRYGI